MTRRVARTQAKDQRRSGTQSIERAVLILRHLVSHGDLGWRLLDLSAECGIGRTTTHRVLSALVRERLAEQRADRRYVPGPLLFELGISLRGMRQFVTACHSPLTRLVKTLGGVAYAGLRSGPDFVCVARVGERGKASIEIGARAPLITVIGGVAIFIDLPQEEARRTLEENMRRVSRFDERRIRTLKGILRRSEAAGYGIVQGALVPGVGACGVAVHNRSGEAFAAIALVGALESFSTEALPKIVDALRREAATLQRLAAEHLS